MKHLKTTIAILTLLFTMASCNKDDEVAPDPKTFQYRIKEQRDKDNVLKKSYLYNDRNQVVKELGKNGEVNKQYVYNSAGFLINRSNGNDLTSYVLNNDGRILEEITDLNSGEKTKIVYMYNPDGKVIEEKYYKFISASNVFQYEYNNTYYYNSNNQLGQVLSLEYVPIGETTPRFEQTSDYLYDDRGNVNSVIIKKSPVSNGNTEKVEEILFVYDNMKLSNYSFGSFFNNIVFKNNIIEYTVTAFDRNGSVKSKNTIVAKHTYNEAGYITKTIAGTVGYEATTNYILEKIN